MAATDAKPARLTPQNPRIAVVGAGVVGCCIALALRRRGADVTLIDRGEPGQGCSFGNSGAISPGSVAPLAMPGILSSVPGMLLDRDGPLYLPWSYLPRALPWLGLFVASARPERVAVSAKRLAALHAGAIERHRELTRELGVPELFLQRGHLHLYPDDAALAKDAGGWRLREEHGWQIERLDRAGIEALEPNIAPRYTRAMYQADHATILNPLRYVQAMARAFADAGGRSVRAEVRSFAPYADGWRFTPQGPAAAAAKELADARFSHVVVAAGAWSTQLLDPLGLRFALESQRGYHAQFDGASTLVSRTVVLADRKVFVTPMEEGLRVGGTVEIGGLKRPPDARRAESLARIARENFPTLADAPFRTWMGHRPCMPDSVPVIGAVGGYPGLWLAIGHGHLGLTDSVTTADRIAQGLLEGLDVPPQAAAVPAAA